MDVLNAWVCEHCLPMLSVVILASVGSARQETCTLVGWNTTWNTMSLLLWNALLLCCASTPLPSLKDDTTGTVPEEQPLD